MANDLDAKGFHGEADELDFIIQASNAISMDAFGDFGSDHVVVAVWKGKETIDSGNPNFGRSFNEFIGRWGRPDSLMWRPSRAFMEARFGKSTNRDQPPPWRFEEQPDVAARWNDHPNAPQYDEQMDELSRYQE